MALIASQLAGSAARAWIAFSLSMSTAGAAAAGTDFDWHNAGSQRQMNIAFAGTAKLCAALFGFTLVKTPPPEAMPDKLDSYLLLRDNPDGEVERWAIDILEPVNAVAAKTSTGLNGEDEHEAAAAAVAASENPDVYEEAKARFVEGAMAPFRRALDACSAGAHDPLLGKYYWTGSGSADEVERQFSDGFADFVAELKKSPRKSK